MAGHKAGHPKMFAVRLDFYNGSFRSVLHDGSDTIVAVLLVSVHLALSDDLAIGCLEAEERLAVLRDLLLEALDFYGILLHGLNAVEACSLGVVTFAGKNYLAVGCFEIKLELTVLSYRNFKFSHGTRVLNGLCDKYKK